MIVRLQQLCGLRVLHDLGDFFADEIRSGVVGGLVEPEIVVDRHEGQPAAVPARLIFRAALVVAVVERAAVGQLGIDAVLRHLARKAPDLGIVVAEFFPLLLA